MSLFQIRDGGSELLPFCEPLWKPFISHQIQHAGEISVGVRAFICELRDGGLLEKTRGGKLHVQLAYTKDREKPIGFCITSLTVERIGEVEILFVLDEYQGKKLGGQLFHQCLQWMDREDAVEQKLKVVVGNEKILGFYEKYGFFLGYSALFRVR